MHFKAAIDRGFIALVHEIARDRADVDVDSTINTIKAACEAHSIAIKRLYGREEEGCMGGRFEKEDRAGAKAERGLKNGGMEEGDGMSKGTGKESMDGGMEAYAPGFSKKRETIRGDGGL